MSTHPTDQLPTHPQPINKIAALHVAGGDKTGREELLWAQREAFDRAMIEVRLHNMNEEHARRRELARKCQSERPDKHENKLRSWKGIVDKREKIMREVQSGKAPHKLGHQGRVWAGVASVGDHLGWRQAPQ